MDAVELAHRGPGTTIAPPRLLVANVTPVDGAGSAAPLTPGRALTDARRERRHLTPPPAAARIEASGAPQAAAQEVGADRPGLVQELRKPTGRLANAPRGQATHRRKRGAGPQAVVATLGSRTVRLVNPARSGAGRAPHPVAVPAHPASRRGRLTGPLVARDYDLHQARTTVSRGHTSLVTPGPRRERATTAGPATARPEIEVRSPHEGGPETTGVDIADMAGTEVRRPPERPGEIRSEEQQVAWGTGRVSIETAARAGLPGVVLLLTVITGGRAAMPISDALGDATAHSPPLNGAAHAKYQTEKCRPSGAA
jgi:hypothetical protein